MRILAAASPGEVRVAAVDASGLLDYAIWRPGAPGGVGDLHRGRVIARVPAMAGAFVALDGAEGFLPDSDGAATVTAGEAVGVRISRAAQGGKGPRLTARLTEADRALVGTGPPVLLRPGPDSVARLAALHPAAMVRVDDPVLLASLRPTLGARVAMAPAGGAFDPDTTDAVAALAEPAAALPGGARMTVHPTPALVAIDIDLGPLTAARDRKAHAQAVANRALLPALARQIRLRDLGGAIVIDLAGLSVKARGALGEALASALAADPLRPRFLGFSALGLAELLRPRVHPPLHELLAGPHAAGLAALRAAAAEIAATPGRALALRADPAVADRLAADPVALPDLARRAGRPLVLRADRAMPPLGWRLEDVDA